MTFTKIFLALSALIEFGLIAFFYSRLRYIFGIGKVNGQIAFKDSMSNAVLNRLDTTTQSLDVPINRQGSDLDGFRKRWENR